MIYRFNAILIKIIVSYFVATDKLILKFKWKGKRPRVAKTILNEKNKVKGLIFTDLKTYSKATVIKTV